MICLVELWDDGVGDGELTTRGLEECEGNLVRPERTNRGAHPAKIVVGVHLQGMARVVRARADRVSGRGHQRRGGKTRRVHTTT